MGCLVSRQDGHCRWLIQAKSEPGSIPYAQAAPTVQATESNYKRKHGGKATRHLEHFLVPNSGTGHPIWHSSAKNSEQGSKFWQKFNRNIVIELPSDAAESLQLNAFEKWIPANALKAGLEASNLVNTDLRSVVVTSNWSLLLHAGEVPFASPSSSCDEAWASWRAACALSYAKGRTRPISEFQKVLWAKRKNDLSFETEEVPIRPFVRNGTQPPLPGWKYTTAGEMVQDSQNPSRFHDVICLETTTESREVTRWSQPFLRGAQVIHSSLLLRLHPEGNEELQCFLRRSIEPGLKQPEWGPSIQSDNELLTALDQAWIRRIQSGEGTMAQIEQTDEGGRFFQSRAVYTLVALSPEEGKAAQAWEDDATGVWVNIKELEQIVQTPGMTTNELRTVVSLLLAWF